MRKLLAGLTSYALLMAVVAPAALAMNNGRGFYGETNDVVTTNAGFLLIIFFPLFVFVMSMIQWRLEKRKDAHLEAERRRRANPNWRGGW